MVTQTVGDEYGTPYKVFVVVKLKTLIGKTQAFIDHDFYDKNKLLNKISYSLYIFYTLSHKNLLASRLMLIMSNKVEKWESLNPARF